MERAENGRGLVLSLRGESVVLVGVVEILQRFLLPCCGNAFYVRAAIINVIDSIR